MMAGQVIADRYELGERLGLGGMSTVHLAFDRRLERHVAVKLLAEHLAEDQQFVHRFRREALAAARLVHPNIVQVFDFGTDDATARQYIVMEHIRGQSAAEILRDRGRLPVGEGLAIVMQACRGLDYAHRHGVVHRDVKPGNLLRSEDGVVKLADFGIAKQLADESSITQVGSVLGTAAYLAPEQAGGEEATPRSDIYGLGVVTYQLLSGRLPYDATSLTELVLMQQREAPPLLHEMDAEIPPQLAHAVDRALALDPADRYPTADALRESVADGARGVGESGPPTGRTSVVAPATSATRAVRRGGTTGFPATASAAAGAGAGAGAVQRRQPRPGRAPVQPAAPVEDPRARPPRRKRRRAGRLLGMLVVLILIAVGAGAALVATDQSSRGVQLRNTVGRDAHDTADKIKQFIDDNTH
jgi:eukaryotic-like serine/threonine-protein kinase